MKIQVKGLLWSLHVGVKGFVLGSHSDYWEMISVCEDTASIHIQEALCCVVCCEYIEGHPLELLLCVRGVEQNM